MKTPGLRPSAFIYYFEGFETLACVAGGFGGRESRAKTSGVAAGEMGREA